VKIKWLTLVAWLGLCLYVRLRRLEQPPDGLAATNATPIFFAGDYPADQDNRRHATAVRRAAFSRPRTARHRCRKTDRTHPLEEFVGDDDKCYCSRHRRGDPGLSRCDV
jgi:hypothetical protein